MRVHVALALLVLSALSGCTSGKDDAEADLLASDGDAAPVLYLNLTVGDQTHQFTTKATGHAGHGSASATATAAANATGNGTGSASGGPGGNATAGGNSTGNATGGAGAGAGSPAGEAPLNVTAQVGASGLPAGAVRWELDFGEGGNATNGTATGASLPASANHTYLEPGEYNVTLSVRVANGTAQTLRATVTVEDPSDAASFGPVPEPIVIEGSITGSAALVNTGSNEETFELEAPVASMTITMEFDSLTGEEDLDWAITGPGGETASGEEVGQEEPAVFEAPTPGTWTIEVIPYLGLETSYTITVTFA